MTKYAGRCLCGHILYQADGNPQFPHLCSCRMCQKWSGALTVAWVEFPLKTFKWTGPGGEPTFYRSSQKTQRGFCPKCGGAICAKDDGYEYIAITIASLLEPESIMPTEHHSYSEEAPAWWKIKIAH